MIFTQKAYVLVYAHTHTHTHVRARSFFFSSMHRHLKAGIIRRLKNIEEKKAWALLTDVGLRCERMSEQRNRILFCIF